ncbi:hypothetical protein THAOC_21430, partial [Thalassiosira oceanica]
GAVPQEPEAYRRGGQGRGEGTGAGPARVRRGGGVVPPPVDGRVLHGVGPAGEEEGGEEGRRDEGAGRDPSGGPLQGPHRGAAAAHRVHPEPPQVGRGRSPRRPEADHRKADDGRRTGGRVHVPPRAGGDGAPRPQDGRAPRRRRPVRHERRVGARRVDRDAGVGAVPGGGPRRGRRGRGRLRLGPGRGGEEGARREGEEGDAPPERQAGTVRQAGSPAVHLLRPLGRRESRPALAGGVRLPDRGRVRAQLLGDDGATRLDRAAARRVHGREAAVLRPPRPEGQLRPRPAGVALRSARELLGDRRGGAPRGAPPARVVVGGCGSQVVGGDLPEERRAVPPEARGADTQGQEAHADRSARSGPQGPNPRDDPYCAEVLRRCVKISKGHARELVERGDEALGLVLNENCHICRSRKETVLMFPCGRHGYCENHCRTRLSCAATDYNPEERTKLPVDHCPVCSLTCTCAKCERKLDEVGGAMKVLCKKQGCGPGDVVMERVFEMGGGTEAGRQVRPAEVVGGRVDEGDEAEEARRRGGGGGAEDSGASRSTRSAPPDDKAAEAGSGPPPKKKQKKEKKRKKKPSNEPRRTVLRVPVRELPRECHLNQDYDPSTPADFAKVFCPGRAPVERAGPPPAPDGPEKFQKLIPLPVDGHFHKCCVCDDDLTADDCHYCSVSCRGFHARCLEGGDDATVEGWECTRSRVGDRTVSDEEDIATGANDDAVRESFGRYADLPAFASAVSVLGDVKSILDRLVRYEYGWVFAHPVDVSVITDYGALVSRPMDYATVAGMIDRGAYDPARYKFSSLDDLEKIVLQALVDVEQVFQNCFVYNTRGCQFYRAGEVQERKWTAYYDRHIGDRLTEGVRSALAHFRGACRAERAEKAQIRVVRVSKTSNTAVAVTVVDPTTMSLVKQYLSKASAIQALQHLSKAGYECEVDVAESGAAKFRLDAADGSGTTLFGYLWIRTNKLHSGKFVVAKAKE